MKKICLIVCATLLCFSMSGCIPTPNPHLTIQNHAWVKEYHEFGDFWLVNIMGQAINDGDITLSYAEIWAKFYVANNIRIGESPDVVYDLEVGEVWLFSISWAGSEFDHFELSVGKLSY